MDDILAQYKDVTLLKAFASLTHRIHAARDGDDPTLEIRLRDERDVLQHEILRRMGSD